MTYIQIRAQQNNRKKGLNVDAVPMGEKQYVEDGEEENLSIKTGERNTMSVGQRCLGGDRLRFSCRRGEELKV